MTTSAIGLAELIDQVKRELLLPSASDAVPLLAVDEIELELAVTVEKELQGGIHIQVVELGGRGKRSHVHTVRVRLLPLLTHQELVTKLKQGEDWTRIEEAQIASRVKEPATPLAADEYRI